MTSILSQVPVYAALLLAVAPTTARGGVNCGGHNAGTCSDCPQGNGAAGCSGDCEWFGSTDTDHRGQCKPLGPFQGWTDITAEHRTDDFSATDFCMGPNRAGETHMVHLYCFRYTEEQIEGLDAIWGNNDVGYKHNSFLPLATFHADLGCPVFTYALFKVTCVETPDVFPATLGAEDSATHALTPNKTSDDPEEFGAYTIEFIQNDAVAHCYEDHEGYCAEVCRAFKMGGKSLFKLVHAYDYIDFHKNGFGSHPYRSDSNVDNMVIHHGLLKPEFVGYVNITCLPDPVADFVGSTQNGMTTFDAPTNQPDKGTFILELIPECFAPVRAVGQPWVIEYIPGCDCIHEPNQCPTDASAGVSSNSGGGSTDTNQGAAGEEEPDSSVGMIIGIIVGVLCVLCILVAAFIINRRISARASAFEHEATMLGGPEAGGINMNNDHDKKDKDDDGNTGDVDTV